jgi:hypothetical protein
MVVLLTPRWRATSEIECEVSSSLALAIMSSVMTVGLPRRCRSARGGGSAPTLVITCSEIPAFSEQE